LPRDVFISVEQRTPGGLTPARWAKLMSILDVVDNCGLSGSDPDTVFEKLERALRAENAKSMLRELPCARTDD
jgi:hypothetical protein